MVAKTGKTNTNTDAVSFDAAIKQIHSGDIKPVYLLYGDEDYLQERFINTLKSLWVGDEYASFGVGTEDGRGMTQTRAVDLIGQVTFFSDRKLVVIDEPAFVPCGRAKGGSSAEARAPESTDDEGDSEPQGGGLRDNMQQSDRPQADGALRDVPQSRAVQGDASHASRMQTETTEVTLKARQGKNHTEKNEGQPLLAYLEHPLSSSCLVLRCRSGKPDRRHKLTAEIRKWGGLVETTLKGPSSRVPFLMEVLEASGKQCNRGLLDQIARRQGSLSFSLRELDKVIAYAGEESIITQEMLDAVLTPSLESNIFRMVDALGARRRPEALGELRALLACGESPFGIFAMMLRQYRLIFRAKAYMQTGMKGNQIAQAMGVQPFIAQKSVEQGKYYSIAELEDAMELFCEKDLAMKSSVPPNQVLEDLLIELGRNG